MSHPFVNRWVPPGMRQIVNRMAGAEIRYRGPYADWNQACAASRGYDQDDILGRVLAASRRVLEGEAVYEKDGVAMSSAPPPSHALAALLMAASLDARLSVVDFGGSLGSHFLQWRRFLAPLPHVDWCVVEQRHFVEAGNALFTNVPEVVFHDDVAATRPKAPNAVLASGVLQFLEDPMAILDELLALSPRMVIIDRTPFVDDGPGHAMTQHVPRTLGTASYPLRILSRSLLASRLGRTHDLLLEFPTPDAPIVARGFVAEYGGSLWLRRR